MDSSIGEYVAVSIARIILIVVVVVACVAFMGGYFMGRPSEPSAIELCEQHFADCKQCGGGLLDENGEPQSLCETGFKLLQDALKSQKDDE